MNNSFIYNILNSQPILIKFALKLFVCKCLSFQTHLLLDLRFPIKKIIMINVLKFRQILFLLSTKMLVFRAEIHEMLVRIANREDPV